MEHKKNDARALGNFILDAADRCSIGVSNLALNKIMYFSFGQYYKNYKCYIFQDKFEAWQYGPVIPEIYHQFKIYENKKIESRATKLNFKSGINEIVNYYFDQDKADFLSETIGLYLKIDPGRLVDWSHEKGGPWSKVWNHDGISNPGMVIPPESIALYFANRLSLEGGNIGNA
jgi:uncharacterized phage-associated protein